MIHSSPKSWEHEASFYAKAEAQRGECLPELTQPAAPAHVCPAAFLRGLEGELAFAVTVPSICPHHPQPKSSTHSAWPEPCGTSRSYLAGGDPGPSREGRAGGGVTLQGFEEQE